MDSEKLSTDLTEKSTSQIEKQKAIGVEMAEKSTNGETKVRILENFTYIHIYLQEIMTRYCYWKK